MCDFITKSSTLPFLEQFANTVVVILQRYIWELIEGYGEKGHILRSKLESCLMRNCITVSKCNSQSYTFLFSDQHAN